MKFLSDAYKIILIVFFGITLFLFAVMTGKFSVLSIICLFASSLFAQVPAQIVEFEKDFGKTILAADAKYASATNSMPRQYVANLEKMAKDFQSAGDLDGILAVKNEIKRFKDAIEAEPDPFESVPEMPQDAFVDSPQSLRKLQEDYIVGFSDASKIRKEAVSAASEKLKDRIEEYQKELVKAGKLDEALSVKDLSQKINVAIRSGKFDSFLALASSDELPSAALGARADTKVASRNASESKFPWQNWKYVGNYPFSKDLLKFRHPDVPDTMSVSYDSEKGRLFFSGICPVSSFQCGSDFCTTVGRAVEWKVASPDFLEKIDLLVKSKRTTVTMKSGPQLQLAVFSNGRCLKMLNVPLIHPEIQLQILRNPKDPSDFILYWRGTKAIEHFSLNADSSVNIVLGVSFCNKGERCETTVEFQ